MTESNEIINSLKRLQRAGSDESRATQKLVDAARELGEAIAAIVPSVTMEGVAMGQCHPMPHGYAVAFGRLSTDGENRRITTLTIYNTDTGRWDRVDTNRESALAFARIIADGWLDELAEWLEGRNAESTDASARLERAAEALR